MLVAIAQMLVPKPRTAAAALTETDSDLQSYLMYQRGVCFGCGSYVRLQKYIPSAARAGYDGELRFSQTSREGPLATARLFVLTTQVTAAALVTNDSRIYIQSGIPS